MMVRIGEARDAGALAGLHARAFAKGWSEAEIAQVIAPPHAIALGAFTHGEGAAELVGFVLAWTIGEEAEILTLAVDPQQRRAGVAGALMRALMAQAAAHGAQRVLLEVGEDNGAARALYESAGFAEIGRRKGYYSGAEGAKDALVLRLVLHKDGAVGE